MASTTSHSLVQRIRNLAFILSASVALLPPSAQSQSWFTNNLVAYYPLDGTGADESANANDAVLTNALYTTNRFGESSHAVRLNGLNAYGQLPGLNFGANFTITAWFKFGQFSGRSFQRVFDLGNGAGVDNIILAQEQTSSTLRFEIDGPPGNAIARTPTSLSTNAYYQAACVLTNGESMLLYLNGELVASNRLSITYNSTTRTNNYLGKSNWSSDSLLQGEIDDIRIYSRALPPKEIASLYYYESRKKVQMVMFYNLNFDGLLVGTNYQLQASTNLLSWTNWGAPFTATSDRYTNTIPFQRVDDWNKLFFRLIP